ncbi:MAG: hypothetical protein DHS20C18_40370 [Saprospiraceae bacterium]|nr:MAG: hypothetical protein DHS20C18_40370 [Saprospiraceae bacterium]
MSAILFNQIASEASNYYLYAASDNATNQEANLFLLFGISYNPGPSIDFTQALSLKTGIYFFYDQDTLPATNLSTLFASLGALTKGVSIVWINEINANGAATSFQTIQLPVPTYDSATATLSGNPSTIFLKVANTLISLTTLMLNPNLAINIAIDGSNNLMTITDTSKQALQFTKVNPGSGNTSLLRIFEAQVSFVADSGATTLPNTSAPKRGALNFSGDNWDLQTLYFIVQQNANNGWGGFIRYYYPGSSGNEKINYPFFGRISQSTQVDLFNQLDLLYPTTASRTYFILKDPSSAPDVFANPNSYLFTTRGDKIQLQPNSNIGYYFSTIDKSKLEYYLAPLGKFSLELPANTTEAKVMCGLSGMEFARIKNGDALQLIPGQPAFAPTFLQTNANNNQAESLLTNAFVTSWTQILSDDNWRYFSQPTTLANFSNQADDGDCDFPVAGSLDIQVGSFPTENSENPGFPMALYGNVFLFPNNADQNTISAFEQQILASSRYNLFIPSIENGDGPVFTLSDGTPINAGQVITSSGFLVTANGQESKAGTWNSLRLAISGDQHLQFDPPNSGSILNPPLSLALMNTQGFLVMDDWAKFSLEHQLTVSGFTFSVNDLPASGNSPEVIPIMIFKYATGQSLQELIGNTNTWTNPSYFLKEGETATDVQATLDAAIQQAESTKGQPQDPFKYFRDTILTQPSWTGVIVFNCPIDGGEMPPDFQMLFAGVSGPLTAHHFGVEVNQIGAQNDTPTINQSSIFGVIYYTDSGTDDSSTATYEFITKELIVVFQNSSISDMQAQVGMKINALFQRDVFLQDNEALETAETPGAVEPNTFYIQGQYQKNGNDGTVVFNSSKKHTYAFNPGGNYIRVLDSFVINNASLQSTGSTAQGQNTLVTSRFEVGGQLYFSNPIVPGATQPDLYSYGSDLSGLPTRGIAFNISVLLDETGQAIDGSSTAVLDTSNLAVQSDETAVRSDSLLASLPFKLSELVQAADGSTISLKKEGQSVNVIQLAGYTTTAPIYALKYNLSLGSLGSLSDAHGSIDATMLLGWGPSETTPDNDGALLYMQLPEASAGFKGFNLQGILKTVFGDANLMEVPYTGTDGTERPVYVLLFNNVALSILNVKFPPGIIADFILFSDPTKGSGSNIAWNIAAVQK